MTAAGTIRLAYAPLRHPRPGVLADRVAQVYQGHASTCSCGGDGCAWQERRDTEARDRYAAGAAKDSDPTARSLTNRNDVANITVLPSPASATPSTGTRRHYAEQTAAQPPPNGTAMPHVPKHPHDPAEIQGGATHRERRAHDATTVARRRGP